MRAVESRLVRVEQGIHMALRRIDKAEQGAAWNRQQMREAWAALRAPAASGTSITVTKTIKGCFGLAVLPGATMTVTDTTTATVMGTATSDGSGVASVTFSGNTGDTYSVTIDDSPRFASHTDSGLTFIAGTNVLATLSMTAAGGYVCASGCNLPIPTTLFAFDSKFGDTTTLTYDSGSSFWRGCALRSVNSFSCGGVGASGTHSVPVRYFYRPSLPTMVVDFMDTGNCGACYQYFPGGVQTTLTCANAFTAFAGFGGDPMNISSSSGTCAPTNMTFVMVDGGDDQFGYPCTSNGVYGTTHPTITVTE